MNDKQYIKDPSKLVDFLRSLYEDLEILGLLEDTKGFLLTVRYEGATWVWGNWMSKKRVSALRLDTI